MLRDKTMAALRARFEKYEHSPSEGHWTGLEAIADFIQRMADGTAEKNFAYSALPVGMGKTSVVVETVKALLADPKYADTETSAGAGVVIFVNTLEQIPILITAMGLEKHQFAVVTGKANTELNQMGRGHFDKNDRWVSEHTEAQILFTTQQKLLQVAKHIWNFDVFFMKYCDKPRAVRIWDEAILPAKADALKRQDVLALAAKLRFAGHYEQAEVYESWERTDLRLEETTWVPNPYDPEVWKLDPMEQLYLEKLFEDDEKGAALLRLAGQKVRVHYDTTSGDGGSSAIGYTDILPNNFAPLLILDASGELKVTYDAWAEGRGNLVALPAPGKTYCNLTIKHLDASAGKGAHRNVARRNNLAEVALRAFEEVPGDEPLLVVQHKPEKPSYDMAPLIRAKVRRVHGEAGVSRLRFVTWGLHMASNAFANIKHVLVLGIMQYSPAMVEASWRAANATPADKLVTAEQYEATRYGEIKHNLFQAVGRGAVRKCVNGDVPEGCTLYAVFSTLGQMHIPQRLLSEVFPGAVVETWAPFGSSLRSAKYRTAARQEFYEALLERMGGDEWLDVRVNDFPGQFDSQMVRQFLKEDVIQAKLAEAGVYVTVRDEKTATARRHVYRLSLEAPGVVKVGLGAPALGKMVGAAGAGLCA